MKKVIKASLERGQTKTYRNKRNENKYLEVKKANDGHSYARQYMKWDTPEGEVKNYTGAKDAKRGRYFRNRQSTINDMLDDYEEVEECDAIQASTYMDGVYESADPEMLKDMGYEPDESDEDIRQIFNDYGLEFKEWALAKDEYWDMCANDGEDIVAVGSDNNCYIAAGDRLIPATNWAERLDDYSDEADDDSWY